MTHPSENEDSREPPTEFETTEFEKLGRQPQLNIVQEFIQFVLEYKMWWMIPILLVLGLVGVAVVLSATGAAPFIYTLF